MGIDNRKITAVLKDFATLTSKPEDFLSCHAKTHDKFKVSTKQIYDFCKNCENNRQKQAALPELIIKQFDDEQIWQQLELQNTTSLDGLVSKVAGILTGRKTVSFLASDVNNKQLKTKTSEKDVKFDKEEEDEVGGSDETDEELDKIKAHLEASDEDGMESFSDIGDGDDEDANDFDFETSNILSSKDNESSESEDHTDNEINRKKRKKTNKKQGSGSIVDDKFFKLAEMEAFLEQEDAKELKKQKKAEKGKDDELSDDDEDEEDMFVDLQSEDEAHYSDFFDLPDDDGIEIKKKKFKSSKNDLETAGSSDGKDEEDQSDEGDDDLDESEDEDMHDDSLKQLKGQRSELFDSDSEGEDVNEILGGATEKSTYEKRQEKLREKIKKMEAASLEEKTWQLKGETFGTSRPENSLLEEHLQFDHIAKIPKVITEETTESLESLIKQRVKDKAWDDVERKVKPKENPFEYKKRITLDQEKSKLSLGEIYEQEYIKQQQEEEDVKTDPNHEEIKKMMQSLFIKLDALSNFHYTPKPAAPEIKIVSNMPTIAMEEVAPVSVSENNILAPEEVQDKLVGELKAKTEKTDTDRKRERRLKKQKKREKQKEKERREKLVEKLNPGLGNKYSKEKAKRELEKQSKMGKGVTMIEDKHKKTKSSLTSSKTFFTQLQEEVRTQIKSKKAEKRKKDKNGNIESKKLKL